MIGKMTILIILYNLLGRRTGGARGSSECEGEGCIGAEASERNESATRIRGSREPRRLLRGADRARATRQGRDGSGLRRGPGAARKDRRRGRSDGSTEA